MNEQPPKKLFMAQNNCMNASYDFNILQEGLRRKGYVLTDGPEDADEIIFSGCGVHRTWVDDAIRHIDDFVDRAPNALVKVTGCVARIDADRVQTSVRSKNIRFESQNEILKTYAGLDLAALDRELVQDTRDAFRDHGPGISQLRKRVPEEKIAVLRELEMLDRKFGTNLLQQYRSTTRGLIFFNEEEPVGYITVSRSCLYRCSFCAIPKGRGAYASVPLDDILNKARGYLKRGIRHLILIGDEVGNYGRDTKSAGLADLIEAVFALDPALKLSIRYVEPKPFWKNRDLFRRYCEEGRFKTLYVPLQSGSQRILDLMRRNYKLAPIVEFYSDMRRNSDTVFICNWMVGFPGETDEDFRETTVVVQELNPQVNLAIPFSPRPDTPAMTMEKQIPDEAKKARLLILRGLIADLKVAELSKRFPEIDDELHARLCRCIGEAEMIHIDDFPQSPVQ